MVRSIVTYVFCVHELITIRRLNDNHGAVVGGPDELDLELGLTWCIGFTSVVMVIKSAEASCYTPIMLVNGCQTGIGHFYFVIVSMLLLRCTCEPFLLLVADVDEATAPSPLTLPRCRAEFLWFRLLREHLLQITQGAQNTHVLRLGVFLDQRLKIIVLIVELERIFVGVVASCLVK